MQISTWQHSIAKLLKRALFNPLHPNVLWSINQYSILKKGINRFSIISFYSSKNKIFQMRPLILPPQIGNDKVGISIKIRCQFPGFGNIGNISLAEEINVHTFGNQRGRHAE